MIEIYRRVEGKDRLIASFDTFENLFRTPYVDDGSLSEFGYDPSDRVIAQYLFGDSLFETIPFRNSQILTRQIALSVSRCRYICYEDGNLVTPDRLVGLYREWRRNRPRWRWRWHCWCRRRRGEPRPYRARRSRRWCRWRTSGSSIRVTPS